ncbi:hypothetical protein B0T22DRAFT_505093, partial [Podospora appendiculata]
PPTHPPCFFLQDSTTNRRTSTTASCQTAHNSKNQHHCFLPDSGTTNRKPAPLQPSQLLLRFSCQTAQHLGKPAPLQPSERLSLSFAILSHSITSCSLIHLSSHLCSRPPHPHQTRRLRQLFLANMSTSTAMASTSMESATSPYLQRNYSSRHVLSTTGENRHAWSRVIGEAKDLVSCYQAPEHFPGYHDIKDPAAEQLTFEQMRAAKAKGPAGRRPMDRRERKLLFRQLKQTPRPRVFHLFPRLPQELQDMIWKLTVPAQAIKTVLLHDWESRPLIFFPSKSILHFADINLYRICHRSRALAISTHGHPQRNGFPFNPKTDVVELPVDEFVVHCNKSNTPLFELSAEGRLVVHDSDVSADSGSFFLCRRQQDMFVSSTVLSRVTSLALTFASEDEAPAFHTSLDSRDGREAPTAMVANYRDTLRAVAAELPGLRSLAITMAQPDDCGYIRPVDTDYCRTVFYRRYSTAAYAVYECKRLALLDALDTLVLVDGDDECPFPALERLVVAITNRYCSDHAMAHSPFTPLLTGAPIGRSFVKVARDARPALVGAAGQPWDPAVPDPDEERDFILDADDQEPVSTAYARYLEKAREGGSGVGYNLQHWYDDEDLMEIFEDDEFMEEDEKDEKDEDEDEDEVRRE